MLLSVRDPKRREVSAMAVAMLKKALVETESKAWQTAYRQQINNLQSGICQW
ncbi:MAG TPA: hypothetical protein VFS81_18185 [Candidatus Binatia bacterium]|nr:hypothetical protein [Candidatus Binatia bacterium]